MTKENEAAIEALIQLRDGMRANDEQLNDETRPGGPRAPTGDNYNDLFDLVQDALRAAGIAYEASR